MSVHSTDYHDYVFRDGRLVGEFEAMYRNSKDVPWHQDEQADWMDVRLTANLLGDIGPFDEIHDLGCGLGHYLALMKKHLGVAHGRAFGYDISETACAKAREAFPGFVFRPLDLTAIPKTPVVISDARPSARRLFIIRGTLWYVFPKLGNVVRTIRSMMSVGDWLLVVQNFPPLDASFIGKDVIPDHLALIRHFAGSFSSIRHIWYEDTIKALNDNWFMGLFSPRDIK